MTGNLTIKRRLLIASFGLVIVVAFAWPGLSKDGEPLPLIEGEWIAVAGGRTVAITIDQEPAMGGKELRKNFTWRSDCGDEIAVGEILLSGRGGEIAGPFRVMVTFRYSPLAGLRGVVCGTLVGSTSGGRTTEIRLDNRVVLKRS